MGESQTVIVLGAGNMPCAGIAIELARQGTRLILIDGNKKQLQAVEKQIQGFSGQVTVYECDVNNPSKMALVAMEVNTLYGCCDYLINPIGGESVKMFSVKNYMKIHAEGSYAVGWVEKAIDAI